MTQDQLVRALRLPSIPTLSLCAATLVAEAPVVFARTLLTLAVAALLLLSRGEELSGAEAFVELALIPTAWSILALLTPFGGGWWWAQNLGGREPSEREQAAYHDAVQLLQANAEESLRAELVVRAGRALARCGGVWEHADALPRPFGERVSPRGACARARAPRHERRQ
jgi:hypothetical protein